MGKMDEQIIVVRRSALFGDKEELVFQGIMEQADKVVQLEQNLALYWTVMRRGDAEEDPEFKQPIPYAIIQRGKDYFSYRRLGGGAESRLHGKLSIGVGGHMNAVEENTDFHQVMAANLRRELSEEIVIDVPAAQQTIHTLGFINDDEGAVGRVHIGILALIQLPPHAHVIVREKDKLEGQWLQLEDLRQTAIRERLESWSAFAVDVLNASSR
ncbi:MAG: hypothetical protein ABF586_13385 [Sporolactobacillus sp.]